MPHSRIAQRELADLLSVLAHPLRLALIFQLEEGERDVSALQEALDAPQSLVSQHLARLRALHLVEERREGRHVYYHLAIPALPAWLADGFGLVAQETEHALSVRSAVHTVQQGRLRREKGRRS